MSIFDYLQSWLGRDLYGVLMFTCAIAGFSYAFTADARKQRGEIISLLKSIETQIDCLSSVENELRDIKDEIRSLGKNSLRSHQYEET